MLVGGGVPVALLAKLAKMLTDEYKLHKSAKEGIQYIRDELENMQAALEKVSEVPPDLLDKQVQIWARNVRKMSYNIEDTIDSFMVVVDAAVGESRSGSSTTCCCVSAKSSLLPRTYKARGDIAVEIERIKKEVEEVSKRRERYRVDSFAAPAPPSDPRLLALYEDEAKLVGIGRSREEIIKLLPMQDEGASSEQKLSILRQVSSNIVDDDPEDKDKDKRCLILIDDIWDEQPWKLIKCVLVKNKLGSKVIMTTRNVDVARSCCSSDKVDGIVHVLERLSDSDSEQLFYYKIFGEDGCPTDLKVVSQKILEKCEGWPLGIIAIASLLANKPTQTKDQWCSVYNSISTGLENNHGVKDMRLILSLSYRDMPVRLRACLLYLSIFQEDQIIGRDDLIRRWVAEDIVQGRQDWNMYELGDEYFNELINRSMIQPTDVDAFGRAQACRVHDLVLECITLSSAQEDFVMILNGQQPFPTQLESIYRLSLRDSTGQHSIPHGTTRLPHVRKLVVSSRAIDSMPSLSIFPVVRVLDLEHCTSPNIKYVGNLVHVSYLRLSQEFNYQSGVCIKLPEEIKLPKETGNLEFLQTLDLKKARIKELPSTVVQLRQVRVLEISPQWINSSLSHLSNLSIGVTTLRQEDLGSPGCLPALSSLYLQVIQVQTKERLESIESTTSHEIAFCCLVNFKVMSRAMGLAPFILPPCGPCSITPFLINEMANLLSCFKKKIQRLSLTLCVAGTKDVHEDFNLGLENLTSLKVLDVELDCRCATISEVQAAEDAMRMRDATDLIANHPAIHVRKRFIGEMRSCEEQEIPESGTMRIEDAGFARSGPCGEGGRRAFEIKVAPQRLESVTIHSGYVIESLAFSYTESDYDERHHTTGPWGWDGGVNNTIPLDPSEFLKEVPGTVGSYDPGAPLNVISSLTLVTSVCTYGPFGQANGTPFSMAAPTNSSIVGFFGRAGCYIC
ncbi:hypothetical protein VPH35_041344 [Triticum aestivum]